MQSAWRSKLVCSDGHVKRALGETGQLMYRQHRCAGVAEQVDAADLRLIDAWVRVGKLALQNCSNSGKPLIWQSRAKPL